MLVVVTNNKGGQGKTFISTLLAFCLMKNPDNIGKIVCCDRNLAQQNFAQNLMHDKAMHVVTDDPLLSAIGDTRMWLVDTSPDILENVKLIQRANIVIVPVGEGFQSVQGLKRIHEIRGKQDLKVIMNEWCDTGYEKKIEGFLIREGYNIIGRMPKYRRIMQNIDMHRSWEYGLTEKQMKSIIDLLLSIFK